MAGSRKGRAAAICFLMLVTAVMAPATGFLHTPAHGSVPAASPNLTSRIVLNYTRENLSGLTSLGQYHGQVRLFLSFYPTNETQLNSLLASIDNTGSPLYHKYLSKGQFDSMFGGQNGPYLQADAFLSSNGLSVTKYPDRLGMAVSGSSYAVGRAFGVSFTDYVNASGAGFYGVSGQPSLPGSIASHVSGIVGFSNVQTIHYDISGSPVTAGKSMHPQRQAGYPQPVTGSSYQYIYGSDLQVAYDEQSLLNITYPSSQVVATILWAGTDSSGNPVGAFVPSDISTYFSQTIPSNEPMPKIYGVPVGGAAPPGNSAANDTTGTYYENTLDLEMVGSMAPGASVYNVYGPSATYTSIDNAFAYILNPNSSFSSLDNVSVVTNSWGGSDSNNTAWYTYLQEAAARGITVLASSGDSGDYSGSSKWVGSVTEFPSSMAYNNFGVTAVGGTSLMIGSVVSSPSYLHITSQLAWNLSSQNGYAGSSGGISSVFPEPSWQRSSQANAVIAGAGRGTPDIGAISNDTVVGITIGGAYGQYVFGGTSVASPVEAGIFAEINAVLNTYGEQSMGFVNPSLYSWGDAMISAISSNQTTGFVQAGTYNSTLPALPLSDVTEGHNYLYQASFGYDLVTGWGSVDAYNLTMYLLQFNGSGNPADLKGVRDNLQLNGLSVTSHYSNASTNLDYNASVQQNFFVANSLGAPVYWMRNAIYISGDGAGGWNMSYTGWVEYPFTGMYPSQTVEEYHFPAATHVKLPSWLNMTSMLTNPGGNATMEFSVNNQNFTLPAPGAEYIIGAYNYSYGWQGVNYTNSPEGGAMGTLSPQFTIAGGPNGSVGSFNPGTAGNLTALLMPSGSSAFTYAGYVTPLNLTTDQAKETSSSLQWSGSGGNWSVSESSGAAVQGIVQSAGLGNAPSKYRVVIKESGLSPGTAWNVTLPDGSVHASTSGTVTFYAENGTYLCTFAATLGFTPSPSSLTIVVNGTGVNATVAFSGKDYNITFTESGYPAGQPWAVNISGNSTATASSVIVFSEPNGTYGYKVSAANSSYSAPAGFVTVSGSPVGVQVKFSEITHNVTFSEIGLPPGTLWNVTLGSGSQSSSSNTARFAEANGSYHYLVAASNGYIPSPSSGTVHVNGSAVSVSILFSLRQFDVTFHSSGLPSGTLWFVNITGGGTHSSSTGILSFQAQNGTYSYVVSSADRSYAAAGGSFLVNGSSVNLTARFAIVSYSVEFNESGLPAMQSWHVAAGNLTVNGSGASLTVFEPNGTYVFTIGSAGGYAPSPQVVTVTVNGNSVIVPVSFSQPSYAVEFDAAGLPAGAAWSLSVSDGQHLTTSTTAITLMLADGNYSYTGSTPSGRYVAAGGSLEITGSPQTVYIQFSEMTYTVTFTEQGLPAGSHWSVSLGGATRNASTGSLLFNLANGTYNYTCHSSSSFTPAVASGNITVNGSSVSVTVSYTSQGSSVIPELPGGQYQMAFILILVFVVAGAIAWAVRRRR